MVNTANGAGSKGREKRQKLYKLKLKVKGIKQLVHALKGVIFGLFL